MVGINPEWADLVYGIIGVVLGWFARFKRKGE